MGGVELVVSRRLVVRRLRRMLGEVQGLEPGGEEVGGFGAGAQHNVYVVGGRGRGGRAGRRRCSSWGREALGIVGPDGVRISGGERGGGEDDVDASGEW